MNSDWQKVRLADVIEITGGGTPKTSVPEYWGGNIPWLSVVDFGNVPRWVEKTEKQITKIGLEKSSTKILNAGDIIISARGTVGALAQLKIPMAFNQSCYGIRGIKSVSDTNFLFYVLKDAVEQLKRISHGGVFDTITKDTFKNVEVSLPNLVMQAKIASVLGSIDDRITLLRKTNETLESIAKAIFKSWFVDFNPVKAKSRGELPIGMDEATAALFPDSFEESELGMIPSGWQMGAVEDLCGTITNGGTPARAKKEFWDGGNIPWFKTGELADGFLLQPSEEITESALEQTSVKVLPENSVLMAIYAAPTVGRLGVLTEPACFNQACTGMAPKPEVGTWFLYWTLYFGRQWFNGRANGAAQQNISKAIVSSYKVVIPEFKVLNKFNEIFCTLHGAIRNNSELMDTLSRIRDTLLPRLISGQLTIPDDLAHVSGNF